ncbi:MAG: IPT/TIG domain-containing protein [Acidobacteriota bacterium]
MRTKIFKLGLIGLFVAAGGCLAIRFLSPGWFGFPTYASVETICPGDVNHDEQRDIRDVVAIQAHILGKTPLSGDLLIVADVNQDNQVDVLDIVRLVQHITRRKLLVDCQGTLLVTPASLSFGDVRVGTGKDLTLAVSNGGNAKLTITAVSSTNPQFEAVSPAVPFEVGPGAERAVTVRYSPSSVATHSGTITISASSGGAAMNAVVNVSGAGLTAANPSPTLTSLTPSSVTAGGGVLTLTVTGTNFVSDSKVLWDGEVRPTTFVSAAQLQAAVAAADVASADGVLVRVQSPPPGGGVSSALVFTINSAETPLPAVFWIRYMAPKKGPAGSAFTLLGKGFSPVLANNTVTFSKSGTSQGVSATLTAATETTISGTVPPTMTPGVYAVDVTVSGQSTAAVGFEVTTGAAALDIRPSSAVLLMPPGTGKEYLLIGGGTPPYKLKPLSAEQQVTAKVELKGNVVEVTGLSAGEYGSADVTVQVEDSAPTPATDTATVRVQNPKYSPDFDIIPHTLLAGSSPAFTIRVNNYFNDMRTARTRIKIEKGTTDFSKVPADGYVGFGDEDDTDFNAARVTGKEGTNNVNFEIVREYEYGLDTIGKGTCEPGVLTIFDEPTPGPESVFRTGTTTHFILYRDIYGLPAGPDETFNITAVFTSVSVNETRNVPITVVRTRSFKTVAAPSGGPAIRSIYPDRGEIGREVWLLGSGFSTVPAENQVTFAGPGGTRVPAIIKSAGADRLAVYVPDEAQSGAVEVSVNGRKSNPHEFWARFHPTADLFLVSRPPGSPACLTLLLQQPNWEVGIASSKIVLDKGSINTALLTVGDSAGSASLIDAYDIEIYQIVYGGQEASGARRHFFELRSGSSLQFPIYVSANADGQGGVTIETALSSEWIGDLLDARLFLEFSKPWYVAPAGTSINASIEAGSARWLFFRNSEMLVQMTRTITMP